MVSRRLLGAAIGYVCVGALVVACGGASKTDGTTDGGSDAGSSCGDPATHCIHDGGSSGSDDGGSTEDGSHGDGASCPMTYSMTDKACATVADCTTVAVGCYCGAQPVIGIAKSISALATACEAESAKTCARGCANSPGQVAEDGQNADDGGTIVVKCDMAQCHTVVE
jgi:hypothetical protein